MKEFLDYLEKNLMCYTVVDEGIVEIGGSTFELYKPAYDGALFDEDFNFVGIPASDRGGESVGTECDYYAYRFGGVYYMLPRGKENDVKLIRLKYVGQAAQEIPTEVFLGVHGQYEITSGSGPYSEWCRKAKFLGVHTLGICEKNSLAGALKFQEECQKNGLKSVIGMECTVSDEPNDYRFTVKVYARNEKGWRDLLTINKFINCDNPKYISLSDFNAVTRNNDDLVLFLDPKTLDYSRLKGLGLDAVIYQLDPVEYTDNSRDEKYLKNLKAFFKDRNLVPVASIDAWYLDEEYSCIRPRLQSIGGTTAYDSDNQYFKANDQYFLELASMFPDTEQGFEDAYSRFTDAVDLLKDIADAIDFTIDVKTRHLPRYKMTPEEASQFETNEDLFWSLIEKGLEAHPDLLEDWGDDVIAERIDREVGVIKLGEAIDYFLITWDIINWCHCNGIMTGISRGSAGGCLVSYLLGITKLDPMKYDLLFERFLNAGRVKVSLPDIDCDYPGEDRPRVKKYMEERYGWKQVCSVGTYSALQLRAAIKDMARVYGLNFQETNEMMKVFDVKDRKPEDLFKIACAHSRVKEFVKAHPDLINEVMLIMPAPKAQSIHACAMMVFPDEHDMFRWVPIRKQGEDYVTEWEGGEMDAAGFLKEDVLGVKQFDKFQDMVRLIRENEDVDLDIFSVPLDDAEVYRYFQNGWNEDNFHFGSSGLTGYCKQMKPENIEDLIAAISLYRPGAMENNFHNEYVSRKEGNQKVEYFVGTEAVLQNTYGVFCIAEDSEVLTERGLVKIQDIIPGKDRVKTEDGSYQTVYLKKDNGMREVVRVVSNFGREVVCTPNHKLLTKRGWVEAQNLVKNDELCCWFEQPARIDNLTEKENLEHWLIGFFLAEGTCGSTPYFSVSNKRVAEKIKNLLLELLSDVTVDIKEYPHKHKSGRIGVSTRVSIKSRHGNNGYFNKDYKPNPFIQLLKKWGIWGQTCYTKRLPVNYSLSMLAGLLEGDGCLTNYTLRMCNKELLKDVYMGLQSYGVHSSFFHQKDAMAVSWNDINHILPLRLFDTKKLKRKSSTNYGWGRVKRVVELELPKRVYDLSVENIHSFTVSGCVVANCYQEQIMQLCRELGGLSLVEADDVRKAMVKKKYEALQQYKERFIPYYRDNYGVSQEYSEKVWDAIDKASTYLFNRSHAAAYAITGYISQWIKVHYPIEYWSVAFKYAQDLDYPRYIAEINKTGACTVKTVDINISHTDVVIDFKAKALYWSISGVKQIAEKAASQIIKEREENGQYFSLNDFITRHKWKGSAVNSRIIRNLILAGAFDSLENITHPYQRVDLLVQFLGATNSNVKENDEVLVGADHHSNDNWWWALLQKKLSGLAFFDYDAIYRRYGEGNFATNYEYVSFEECLDTDNRPNNGYVIVAGYVTEMEIKKTRKGEVMCKLILESNYEFLEVMIFQTEYKQLESLLTGKANLMIISGSLTWDNRKEQNILRANYETNIVSLTL
jgi:DNA polymerase-3 subunit alpha